jgi:hypothetical protein
VLALAAITATSVLMLRSVPLASSQAYSETPNGRL